MGDAGAARDIRYLVPLAGPALDLVRLEPRPGGLTLGRHERSDLLMPAHAEGISRAHARFTFDAAERRWRLADLSSRWGTFVNGVRVAPGRGVPLRDGDLVRIAPWTFGFSAAARRPGLASADDVGQTRVRAVGPVATGSPRDDLLALVLETAAALHDVVDEKQLAERLADAARRGTGLPNAAVLRPADNAGRFEVLLAEVKQTGHGTSRRGGDDAGDDAPPPAFSRSLLAAAAGGNVAELADGGAGAPASQSIAQLGISAALCVPLMLGDAPAAFLYLDARGNAPVTMRPGATEFCVALGRIASLALANLKRIDIERRQALIETELEAAAIAQRWVLPRRVNRVGAFRITGESKPGQYVGGDFFDVIDLGGGKLAVAIGDVAGKGVSASVLMTATQGYLHASLREHGEPARAVDAVNRFVGPRREGSRFVTMWVGVFDPSAGRLTYVDAGHSYALMRDAATGQLTPLDRGRGLPVGLDDDATYAAEIVALPAAGSVVLVSDGIIEQSAAGASAGTDGAAFDMTGVQRSLEAGGSGDQVTALFAAVVDHAGTDQLSDDATAVLTQWPV
jgi:sigma-B regulation protein RsbU (phosphoserine phosphatase)